MLSSLGGGIILEKTTLIPSFHNFNPKTRLTIQNSPNLLNFKTLNQSSFIFNCSTTNDSTPTTTTSTIPPPLLKKRKRYRKLYPGESEGIVEEMRFVAMRLRNHKLSNNKKEVESDEEESDEDSDDSRNSDGDSDGDGENDTWEPRIEGFVKYLVDSKLIFQTLERIVDESNDVSYAYFRRTGLERSEALAKDLKWCSQQDLTIPKPSNPGVTYARYLEDLAVKSAPMFLCHFYNIYFAHISGGQVISKKVSEKLLEGRELEFCKWEKNEQELLKDVRDKLNQLGEHWIRDDKNKCLRETSKSFRFLGQIVRLIIL